MQKITDEQAEMAKFFADAGADVIIGSHPHVVQKVDEIINSDGKKTIVFYSLGNFRAFQGKNEDTKKGAEVDISNPDSPELITSETKPGLTYTLREGKTLDGMADGDIKVGDGKKWTPNITVKGGTSGFYTIKVEK